MKPAWSWQFEDGALEPAPDLGLAGAITPEWAWGGATGAGVKVAVVDTGVEDGNPRVGRISPGVALEYDDSSPRGVRALEGIHDDLFGHGTACAGIIRGLAPECELLSVRVLGERNTGKGTVFVAGLQWCVENGVQVANLSLSTGARAHWGRFHQAVDDAYFARTMLVSAIANVRGPSYPSEFAGVFSVAAMDSTDPFDVRYNGDGPAEFGAPGIDLEVAWKGGRTIHATGNSFAAPHVAGLITLILSKHPGLTPFQVKTVLAAVARNAP